MLPVLLLALLFGVVVSITPVKIYATSWNGVDVINLRNPALGYAANLNYNRISNIKNKTLFFTADKANPNLFTAGISEDGSFYTTGKSYFPQLSLPPFIDFDLVTDVLVGVVLPSNTTGPDVHGTMLQAALAKGYNPGEYAASEALTVPGYKFYSVFVDSKTVPFHGLVNFYVSGWANDDNFNVKGFFIARGTVNISSSVPSLAIMWDRDVSTGIVKGNCYDIYNEIKKPKMWIDNDYLYLFVPGRCAAITKTKLGQLQFKDTQWQAPYYPAQTDDRYVSSADLDTSTGLLFFSLQDYNRRDRTTIGSIDMRNFVASPTEDSLNTGGESHVIVHFGMEGTTRTLFVLASGASKLYRFSIQPDNSLKSTGMAIIPDQLDGLANVIYIEPHLYWSTFSRDASLARIHKQNFCAATCPDHGYCNAGLCTCQEGWAAVQDKGSIICVNKMIVDVEERQKENEASAIALGVCFAFTSVIAAAGWYLWKKQKYN